MSDECCDGDSNWSSNLCFALIIMSIAGCVGYEHRVSKQYSIEMQKMKYEQENKRLLIKDKAHE